MNSKSNIFSKYLGDKETSELFSDEGLIRKILQFEIALAKEQAYLDIIPEAASSEIGFLLSIIKINPIELASGTLQNGVPIIPLLEIVKSELSANNAKYLHYGATSQDAMDTALVLILKDSIALTKAKLTRIIANLQKLLEKHGDTPCMARTRGQLAVPTLFRNKIVAWLGPLERQAKRLNEVTADVLKVQLGGAVGDLAFYKGKGIDLRSALANTLKLDSAMSWHSQRDSLCELTNWMAISSGILGKMGADILVMTQSEIDEVIENGEGGGKSSVMSHKNNPVLSEALVALGKLNAGLQSTQLLSLIHANERDATAWILDWECISQIVINTAAGLNHAVAITEKMEVKTENMKKNVELFKQKNIKE